ncbi:MAG TPA: RNase adapter RapZ [Deltaproteobacteria bacterium]|nr:RNase adapter RapZ [Deltaproteobacteria bacterium]
MQLVVLTGPSGAGKSTAIKVLEDIGFFCVDNLPVTLLPKFLDIIAQSKEITKVAIVVDVRERGFLKEFPSIYRAIKEEGYRGELIYLDADDSALVRRFSETRRRHPLADVDSPLEGIAKERELLKELKASADRIIDTTHFTVHQLKEYIREYFSTPVDENRMILNLLSFGYRYGIPADADIVMDVRFLPNPYFVDEFKGLDGKDERVREFIFSRKEAEEFVERFKGLLCYLVPLYWKEGKAYLTIAIGCTGGKHRSVAMVERLVQELNDMPVDVRKRHRDIEK